MSPFTPVCVVNRYHLKTLEGVHSVQRPGPLGNPWKAGTDGTREEVIARYETWLRAEYEKGLRGDHNAAFQEMVRLARIEPLTISCTCKPKSCHADVVAKVIEEIRAAGIPSLPSLDDGF